MCGAYTSVLGRDVQEILTRFTTNEKTKFKIADGPGILCGAVVRIDETARKARHIERIQIRPEHAECQSRVFHGFFSIDKRYDDLTARM